MASEHIMYLVVRNDIRDTPATQGSKCEEWKDEKKGSATVLYTQIINSQLVYTVHGTHFAEGSAAP